MNIPVIDQDNSKKPVYLDYDKQVFKNGSSYPKTSHVVDSNCKFFKSFG